MNNQNRKSQIGRREFLKAAWGTSLFVLFGQAGVALLRFFRPRIETGTFGGKVAAGRVGEFEAGTVSHIQAGRYYLTRLADGGMIALWHRCTHLGCTVPWREEQGQFICPCHSSVFDPVGEVISGPAPRPLDQFPITIEDGQVVVDTGSPRQRDEFDPSQATYV